MTFVLLMIVMRGLLEAAIADRTELDEGDLMAVIVDLDVMLARRKMPVGDSPGPSASPRRMSPS